MLLHRRAVASVSRRSTLLLMELLVMILVFSLAAAACLGIFVRAYQLTEETKRLDQAVLLAQNGAELLKAGQDPAVLDTGGLDLAVELLPEGENLTRARITVTWENRPLYTLETGWQEGMP